MMRSRPPRSAPPSPAPPRGGRGSPAEAATGARPESPPPARPATWRPPRDAVWTRGAGEERLRRYRRRPAASCRRRAGALAAGGTPSPLPPSEVEEAGEVPAAACARRAPGEGRRRQRLAGTSPAARTTRGGVPAGEAPDRRAALERGRSKRGWRWPMAA